MSAQEPLKYVALGDSYTIGSGASLDESWPVVLTQRLKNKGKAIELVKNLGVNGWTAQDVLIGELPAFKKFKPDVATLLIGTNDWVQGVDAATFRQNLRKVLNEVLSIIPAEHFLIVTVPDFSQTPVGGEYGNGRDIAQGLAEFNNIIIEEAKDLNLNVAELYSLSQKLVKDPTMISSDGLHPSAQGYAKWADAIEPAFEKMINHDK